MYVACALRLLSFALFPRVSVHQTLNSSTSLKMEALPNAVRQALALIQRAESLVPFTSVWAPSEMQSAFRTGYQRFLRSAYDAQAFVNTIEAGRQDAVKKGVFTP
jgi:hypothetical protein